MDTDFRLFPEQASEFAARLDPLYWYLVVVSVVFTLGICIAIIGFAVKYRRTSSRPDRSNAPTANLKVEVVWFVIPLALTMIMFVWGAKLYFSYWTPPENALPMNVVGKQWMWKIYHPEGKQEINELHVPVGRPVKLRMISQDVIHSFYIPNFRVKMDVLPGRYTTLWFTPNRVGEYRLFCAEYCGTSHSEMVGRVVVQEPADYADWVSGRTDKPPEVAGRELFERHRCNTCHKEEPGARGPSLAGIFGQTVPLKGGGTVVVDESYIRESILEPKAKIVAGHRPIMPTFEGQLSEDEIFQIIAYIKSLGEEGS